MGIITKFDTVQAVSEAIQRVIEANDHGRSLEPGATKLRASALADLHEIRAQLFDEFDLRTVPPVIQQDVSIAFATAAKADRNSVRFWRRLAGAR